jgi:hypothetical protein
MILDFFFIAIIIKFSEKSFMLVSMYLIYIGIVGGLKYNNLVEKMLCIFIYALFLWKISIVWNDVLIYIFSCMLREITLFILKTNKS